MELATEVMTSAVHGCSWSPDCLQFAIYEDHELEIWPTERVLQEYDVEPYGAVDIRVTTPIAWRPDGQAVVFGSRKRVMVWVIGDAEPRLHKQLPSDVQSVGWQHDDLIVFTYTEVTDDGQRVQLAAHTIPLYTGPLVGNEFGDVASDMAIATDGRIAIVHGSRTSQVLTIVTHDCAPVSVAIPDTGFNVSTKLAWSPDSKQLCIMHGTTVWVYNHHELTKIGGQRSHPSAADWSAAGLAISTVRPDYQNQIEIYDHRLVQTHVLQILNHSSALRWKGTDLLVLDHVGQMSSWIPRPA